MASQMLDARTDAHVILYFVQCYASHRTDNHVYENFTRILRLVIGLPRFILSRCQFYCLSLP